MNGGPKQEISTIHLALPILFLLGLIVYGLVLRPYVFGQGGIPLEIIFITASFFATAHLIYLGYSWDTVFGNAVKKLSIGLPTIMILFGIGMVIGSWIVSGTIPMFVYYGIKLVNPDYIYVLAFIVPIFFSMLTGTSWGSVGTIGVVILGVGTVINADLAIVAGAVIGGAYFGDKMSPLSDTTNIAALASGVDLYDHINSMLYTTLPSAVIAAGIYTVLGFVYPPETTTGNFAELEATLTGISALFHFNILLLLPVLIVLVGSWKRMPTIPVLLTSSLTACLIGWLIQDYSFGDIVQSIYKGFDTGMAVWATDVPANITELFNRGGLYALNDAIIVALFVFIFIGTLDTINAIPEIMGRVFAFAKSRVTVILSSLFAAGVTNGMTGNQYATSFIIGEAFKEKYDRLGINRKVLSRSIEDYGTMIESLIPWHPTALFMVSVMGVTVGDYWNWQLLSLINLIVAPLLAILGIGCFYQEPTDAHLKK
jgi:NhaC family Na+:H+ antiporter